MSLYENNRYNWNASCSHWRHIIAQYDNALTHNAYPRNMAKGEGEWWLNPYILEFPAL